MKNNREWLEYYPQVKGVHKWCDKFPEMDADEYKELVADIAENGLFHDIVLTKDGLLLDGKHRLRACFDADVEPRFTRTEIFPRTYAFSNNYFRRNLKTGQKSAIGLELEEELKAEAKENQRKAGLNGGLSPKTGCEKVDARLREPTDSPKEREPQVSEIAAKMVGVGARSIDKARKIREQSNELFEQLESGEKDLEPAYKEAKQIERSKQQNATEQPTKPKPSQEMTTIITTSGKTREIAKPKKPTFNKTNDSVDWARWTWNPVTGCEHGCSFCYAREIAHQDRMKDFYPFQFESTYHEYRLECPANTKLPTSDDERDGRVFVCSMADLFGKWVPDQWIRSVFDACLESPEWEYLFLTKWPARYSKMPLIEKAWYGSSVIQQSDVKRVEKAMQQFETNAIKWISLEPMLEPIVFNDLTWCDLVVIGSQTSTNQPHGFEAAFAPEFDWVVDVVNQCREFGVAYYLKANLGLEQPGMKLPKMKPYTK